MIVVEIIEEKIEQLLKEDEELNITQRRKELEELNGKTKTVTKFFELLKEDYGAISCLDIEKLLDEIKQNLDGIEYSLEDIKRYIRTIITVFNEKNKDKDIDLSSSQRKFMHVLMQTLEKTKNIYEENLKQVTPEYDNDYRKHQAIEDEILEFQALTEKICSPNDKELLTQEELELVDKIVKDESFSFERKAQLLLAFKQYNNSISRKNEKVSSKADIEAIKELLKGYVLDASIIQCIEKNREEIVSNANIDNMKGILDYFRSINILSKFDTSSLLIIALYGNLNFIKNLYENKVRMSRNPKIFYEIPSLWIANVEKKESKTRRPYRHKDESIEKDISLFAAAHEISYKEMLENADFLNARGFNVDIDKQDGCKVVLRAPNYKLKRNYRECELYGLFSREKRNKSMTSILIYPNIMDSCDRFIELGLHNYIINHPAAIQTFKPETFALFYKLMNDNTSPVYYEKIYSKTHSGMLSTEATKRLLGYSVGDVDEFLNNNGFIDQRDPRYIPSYALYEETLLDNNPSVIDESVFNNPIVMKLESEFKADDYTYIIGEKPVPVEEEEYNPWEEKKIEEKPLSQHISRPKFLRILSMLESNPQFTGNDKEIFALTYGYPIRMPITLQMFDLISKEIGYDYKTKEENHGLPAKV